MTSNDGDITIRWDHRRWKAEEEDNDPYVYPFVDEVKEAARCPRPLRDPTGETNREL
jgi:hypothetical protein